MNPTNLLLLGWEFNLNPNKIDWFEYLIWQKITQPNQSIPQCIITHKLTSTETRLNFAWWDDLTKLKAKPPIKQLIYLDWNPRIKEKLEWCWGLLKKHLDLGIVNIVFDLGISIHHICRGGLGSIIGKRQTLLYAIAVVDPWNECIMYPSFFDKFYFHSIHW